jgi:hypothetical protein
MAVITPNGRINLIYDFQSQQGFKNSDDKHRIVVVMGSTLYVLNDDLTVDASFPADNILHYAVTSDNGIAFVSNERELSTPYMLCYLA